jgi:hypothetical protein
MPGSHQIRSGSLPTADQITGGLLGRARYPHRRDLIQPQQPSQMHSVPRVGRHAIPGRAVQLRDAATSHRHPTAVRARARPNPAGPDS